MNTESKAKGLKWGPRTKLYYSLQVFNGHFMIKIQMVMSGYLNWIQSKMLERTCDILFDFPLRSCSYLILDGSSSWFSQAHIMWFRAWAPASDDGR
ncbi:hypothetical protein VNO77_14926 [Canavalia gladiata]|uniref:Uncharacterized protein n=1 Tax=Canavalia gladiata TaxID=3824 RepID=A0AAN9LYK4_CANGL